MSRLPKFKPDEKGVPRYMPARYIMRKDPDARAAYQALRKRGLVTRRSRTADRARVLPVLHRGADPRGTGLARRRSKTGGVGRYWQKGCRWNGYSPSPPKGTGTTSARRRLGFQRKACGIRVLSATSLLGF
jgi:hypothetical protein